jgi:WD40 repeat protein
VPDVFISYSRRDGGFVHGLVDDLEARGKSVWIDIEGIAGGEVFPEAIRSAIEQSDAFVFVISPDSVASRYCESEVEYALELHKRLVPVLREPVADEELPEAIRVRNWVVFTPDVDDGAADRLIAAIDTDLGHVHAHTHWLVKALDWEGQQRDRSLLLRGSELAAADAWLSGVGDGAEPAPTALQREYVYASRAASTRRQRLLVVGSLVAVVVALALAGFALLSRNQARSEAVQATSRAWAAESIAQLPIDAERSILLGMAAVRESPTPQAVFALQRALDVSPLRVRLPKVGPQAENWGAGVSYSPDAGQIAEGSKDGSVRIFDAATGALARRIPIGSPVPIVQYSPDGQRLAIAGTKGVWLVDPATGRTVRATVTPANFAENLAFSPDGSTLYFTNTSYATGVAVSNLYRWSLRTGHVRRLTRGTIAGVGSGGGGIGGYYLVQVTPDGRRLIVGGVPGVAVVDSDSGRVIARTLSIPFVWDMRLSPDGTRIAVSDSPTWPAAIGSGQIALLDARTLRRVGTVGPALDADAYTALAFSPDGGRLAYGTNTGTAGVYDLRSGNLLINFPGHTTNIFQLAFSPDGQRVVTAAGDGRAYVWRAAGNQRRSIQTGGVNESADGLLPTDLAFADGGIVARYQPGTSSAAAQVVRRWSVAGVVRPPLRFGPPGPSYVRLSGSGRFAMAATYTQYGFIRRFDVWDVHRRRIVGTARFPGLGIGCCPVLSGDGSMIAYLQSPNLSGGPPQYLRLVNDATGARTRLGASSCVWTNIAFSDDGRRVASSDICGHVGVWDTRTGRPVGRRLSFISFVNLGPVAFSPDGRVLAVANSGNLGEVSLLDISTGHTFAVLTGDTKGIQSIAFSPDGHLVATADLDGTARIWDARTGGELRVLDDPAPLDNVAFSPDGRLVATMDFTGVINLWDACSDCENPGALMAHANRRVTRQLTPAERRTFLG